MSFFPFSLPRSRKKKGTSSEPISRRTDSKFLKYCGVVESIWRTTAPLYPWSLVIFPNEKHASFCTITQRFLLQELLQQQLQFLQLVLLQLQERSLQQ